VLVVHKVVTLSLQHISDTLSGITEALEDGSDVVTFFHGDDTHLIFLIHPNEEVLSIVVVDSTGIRPVATAPGAQQKSGIRLLEQVSVLTQLLFLLGRHGSGHGFGTVQREVLSLELTFELFQSLNADTLGLTALFERTGRRQRKASHGTSGTTTRGENVFAIRIDFGLRELVHVHAGRMLGIRFVATVALLDDNIEKILESLVGLFVTSDDSAGHDVRMTGVIDAGLDALSESDAIFGGNVFVLLVDLRMITESESAQISVLFQVGESIWALVTRKSGTLLFANILLVAASCLNPGWQFSQGRSQTPRVFLFEGHFCWCLVGNKR
jgi:hypothetical protein